MSLETWKKEFYQITPTKKMTKRVAIEHSLRKWKGLLPENLDKHDLELFDNNILLSDDDGGEWFYIDASSCSLCKKYYDDVIDRDDTCNKCPLFKSLGNKCDFGDMSPYRLFLEDGDPNPMIFALENLLNL